MEKLVSKNAVSRLTYVGAAITMMRHMLDGKVPLIGFTGAPVDYSLRSLFFFALLFFFSVDFNGLHD